MMERFFDKLTGRTRVQVLSRRALEPEAKRTWIKSYNDGLGPSPAFYDLAAAAQDGPGELMPESPEPPCWIVRSESFLPLDPPAEYSTGKTQLDLDCIITDNLTGRTHVQVLTRRALEPEATRTWINSYEDGPGPSPALYNFAAAPDDGPGELMPESPEPCWIVRSEKRRSSGSRWRKRLRSLFCMSRESVMVTPFTPAPTRPDTKHFGCQVTEEELSLMSHGPKVTVIQVKPYMVDASTQVHKDEF
ncbi:uncharacterized protein [Engystomops pustulosus]|uniref:uncharacterized protein isoform X1 n=1 Tax=Engystomops pustulosus TaxID=76066 RepID=UPI003AFB2329